LEGLEWFLYNRSPAFDAIVDRMKAANEGKTAQSQDTKHKDASSSSSSDDIPSGTRSEGGEDDPIEKGNGAEQLPPGPSKPVS
jgi:hypothetical protein